MNEVIHANKTQITPMHQDTHPPYEFFRYEVAGFVTGNQCTVNIYDLPPGKSNFPYHYHTANEEIFYIISGTGVFKTPSGEKRVKAGDVIIFPPATTGAPCRRNTPWTSSLSDRRT